MLGGVAGAPAPAVKATDRDGRWRAEGMKLKPLGDRVVVKTAEAEEKTASGIILADTAKEKPVKGTVIAVGDGKWDEDGEKRIPVDVKVGDVVIYSKYGGTEVKVDGEEYLILRADDIYAVLS
jgi:chaperonin GroES